MAVGPRVSNGMKRVSCRTLYAAIGRLYGGRPDLLIRLKGRGAHAYGLHIGDVVSQYSPQ